MTNSHFSLHQRAAFLQQMAAAPLDLLIIGGGITGAGIALDAALRGMKVALLEKKDFASGTSSRSTKLIHGGLRYLKQLELKLVHETGSERAIIHRNAPHIVKPEKMLLPIIEGGSLGKYSTAMALWVYDKLAGVADEDEFKMLSVEEALAIEPLLNADGLKGAALYAEYRTDDARLVIENIKTAVEKGALCVNYAEVMEFSYQEGKVTGVKVQDSVENTNYNLTAKVIVNATGPWVDTLREKDHSLEGKRLHHTKGIHVVLPFEKLPLAQSMYFDVADGRMMFAIPRLNKVYIGTTDTDYKGDLHNPAITKADIAYVLKAANARFPEAKITEADIESTWSGLRPLIHEDGKSPSELSRKDEIFTSDSGLISIAGGKLTGYRKMAERIVDKVAEILHNPQSCTTDKQVLSGGNLPSDSANYLRDLNGKYGTQLISMWEIKKLIATYGTATEQILAEAQSKIKKGKFEQEALWEAELEYGMNYEMVVNAADFWVRRTGRLYFDRKGIPAQEKLIFDLLFSYKGSSPEMQQKEMQDWKAEFAGNMEFL